jgi:hypothetical protein
MDDDPARRFQSALAFAAALEAASRGAVETGADVAAGGTAAVPGADEIEVARAEAVDLDESTRPEEVAQLSQPAAGAGVVPFVDTRVVRPEGEEAVAAPETIEDVDAERDEDEAYHALLEAERRERDALEAEQERTLFEQDEAEADRYADVRDDDLPLRGEADVLAAAAEPEPGPEPHPRRPHESATYSITELAAAAAASRSERVPAPELREREPREGLRMLPLALTLIAGLLLGFAAGYFVGGRDLASREAARLDDSTPSTAAQPGQPAGREWSEQTVAPPAGSSGAPATRPPSAPPPVPSESPEASAPAAARSEPPPAAPTRGRLVVESTPSRAGVTLNGRWRGRTPLAIENLPFGRYVVRIVQPGYTVAREQVALSRAQAERTVTFTLQPERGTRAAAPAAAPQPASSESNGVLFVDSRPRGAQVFVDGRLVGATPLRMPDVPIGSHVVRLELTGHRRWSTSASVSAARETRVTGSLDPIQ